MKIRFNVPFTFLKLGDMDEVDPPVKELAKGDIIEARVVKATKDDHVDLYFEDGTYALEVPEDWFEAESDSKYDI